MDKKEEYKKIKILFEEVCEYFLHDKEINVENYNEVLSIMKEELDSLMLKYKDKLNHIILIEFYDLFINEFMNDIRGLHILNYEKEGFSTRLLGVKTGINVKVKKALEGIIHKYGCRIEKSSSNRVLFNENLNHQEITTPDMDKLLNMRDLFLVSEPSVKRFPDIKFEHDPKVWETNEIKIRKRKLELEAILIEACGIDYKEGFEEIAYLSGLYTKLLKARELIKELHSTTEGVTLMGEANMELYFEQMNLKQR